MQPIEALLFEPVGCLAEFPPDPFLEIAARLFGRERKPSQSGSRAYWHLLNLIESSGKITDEPARELITSFELEAVSLANAYEDVSPALAQLKAMGIRLVIASSLSTKAITGFLEKNSLAALFSSIHSRDSASGIKATPLKSAIASAACHIERIGFLTDTLEGLKVAQSVGVASILMMNDPDEARRLAMHNPSAGIVSLHELPDFLRLLTATNLR
jgi:phosphoglycolate phosphatase-like HAD superfamily hydrolase